MCQGNVEGGASNLSVLYDCGIVSCISRVFFNVSSSLLSYAYSMYSNILFMSTRTIFKDHLYRKKYYFSEGTFKAKISEQTELYHVISFFSHSLPHAFWVVSVFLETFINASDWLILIRKN